MERLLTLGLRPANPTALTCEVADLEKRTQKLVAEQVASGQAALKTRAAAGQADGLAAGQAEYSMQLMDVVMAQLDALEDLERSVVDVVCAALDDVIVQIPPSERITRVVKKAIGAVRGERKILVKVSLPDEAVVRAALNTYLISNDGRTGFVEVFADATLKQGDCIIETSMGVIQASLSAQVTKLKQALNQVVGRASV